MIVPALAIAAGLFAQAPLAPRYVPEALVNAASNTAVPLAPNTIATLYGTNLSFSTRAVSYDDIRGNVMPTTLPGTGVRILIANQPASLYYVSPMQVNLLVPANLIPGKYDLQLLRDGLAGPKIPIVLQDFAPQLFMMGDRFAIAQRQDGSLIAWDRPAREGDFVCLYVTGMGRTAPELPGGHLATIAAPIVRWMDLRVYLDGIPIDPGLIFYAGLTPGSAGLYQVNFRLPHGVGENPEIRLGYSEPVSEPAVRLAVTHRPADEESEDPSASPEEPDPGSM